MTFRAELGNGQKPVEVDGWAGIDGMFEQASRLDAQQFEQQLELATAYRQAFATPYGRLVLEDLVRMFMIQRIALPNDTMLAVGIRQGQSDIPRRIFSMIEFANTGGGRVTGTPLQE